MYKDYFIIANKLINYMLYICIISEYTKVYRNL